MAGAWHGGDGFLRILARLSNSSVAGESGALELFIFLLPIADRAVFLFCILWSLLVLLCQMRAPPAP